MRSMTGFGVGESPLAAGKLVVEIRSVNHRFCDVRVRVPRELGDLGPVVEQHARERFARGRFEIAVRIEGGALGPAALDTERARAAYRGLCALRDEVAPGAEVPFAMLASIPDLLVPAIEREGAAVRDVLGRAWDGAVFALDAMRAREGEALGRDLLARLATVEVLAARVAERAPQVVEVAKKRLVERAQRLRLTAELGVDGARLEQEIAVFADKMDIAEELTRLSTHCAHFSALLGAAEGAVGRRLDFLLQEMAREANTVGAKSQDAAIAHAVVDLRAEIERMREQVQNLE
jgi:uncharacterized protein (TIGR00255 family)